MRKAEREFKRKRIIKCIRDNPGITARELCERFGTSTHIVYSAAKSIGVVLPAREIPTYAEVKKFPSIAMSFKQQNQAYYAERMAKRRRRKKFRLKEAIK